jgi:hypothetical protein
MQQAFRGPALPSPHALLHRKWEMISFPRLQYAGISAESLYIKEMACGTAFHL